MRANPAIILCAATLAAPAGAQNVYTCVDAQGLSRSSGQPIPECVDREQRVLNKDGSVKRIVPPITITLEERRRSDAVERDAVEREALQRRALGEHQWLEDARRRGYDALSRNGRQQT
jgi:Domain of unknown function (DUF4124)